MSRRILNSLANFRDHTTLYQDGDSLVKTVDGVYVTNNKSYLEYLFVIN